MSDPAELQELSPRRAPRVKSLLRGVVYYNNRRSSFDCLVRDISASGARLAFADPVTLPDVFELHIPNKDQTFRARIVWRQSQEAGVTFDALTQTGVTTAQPQDLAARVAKLEADVAILKRSLKAVKSEMEPESSGI
jgi:c-di-GMP-binding flagellar brake protein YcgR